MFSVLLALLPGSLAYGIQCADLSCEYGCIAPEGLTPRHDTALDPAARYGAAMAFDGDLSTAWCEGEPGHGEGKGLTIVLPMPRTIEYILIHGGYFKSAALLAANSRVKTLTMTASNAATGQSYTTTLALADPAAPPAYAPCDVGHESPLTGEDWFGLMTATPGTIAFDNTGGPQDMLVDVIELDIASVFPGAKYTDTCISEIGVLVRPGEGDL